MRTQLCRSRMIAGITEFTPRKCEEMMFDAVTHMMDAASNFETRLPGEPITRVQRDTGNTAGWLTGD